MSILKGGDKIRKSLERQAKSKKDIEIDTEGAERLANYSFTHLHNHSQYSILQSTTQISNLIEKCGAYGMHAVALTDSGNMMAAFLFESATTKYNKVFNEKGKLLKKKIKHLTKKRYYLL